MQIKFSFILGSCNLTICISFVVATLHDLSAVYWQEALYILQSVMLLCPYIELQHIR